MSAYSDLKDDLERRRTDLLEEVAKIERALVALNQPGIVELMDYVQVTPYQPGYAPLLTIRKTNGATEPRRRQMGRSDTVWAALSPDIPKNSLDLESETGMSARDVRSAFKVLVHQGRAKPTEKRGHYVRLA